MVSTRFKVRVEAPTAVEAQQLYLNGEVMAEPEMVGIGARFAYQSEMQDIRQLERERDERQERGRGWEGGPNGNISVSAGLGRSS